MRCVAWLSFAVVASVQAVDQQGTATVTANPIRKVVGMLQAIQKKVTAEGEKQAELYKKFECYCKTGAGSLSATIGASEAKAPAVEADINAGQERKVQLDAEVQQAAADRSAAKASMAQAAAIREKEATAYADENKEELADVATINAAVAALEKGMAGAFVQTQAAASLAKLVRATDDMIDGDREAVLAFLSGSHGIEYAPQSGDIVGLLKQLGDQISQSIAAVTAAEEASIKTHDGLMSSKKKEVAALSAAIESKTSRSGELGVELERLKQDLSDTERALLEDKQFLADLDNDCATKAKEHEEDVKTRAEELVTLADTIRVLNDDDALVIFKGALPAAGSASFVQLKYGTVAIQARALASIRKAQSVNKPFHQQIDLIALALHGKGGFDKVLKMIDGMISLLKDEQADDDNKKQYCSAQFDGADDQKKRLERSVADLETVIADAEQGVETLAGEIKALNDAIAALDASVASATEQRKAEHADFVELIASDSAAKKLLAWARNRLNQFYNPSLASFVQISVHHQDAPDAPPATETYAKKTEESAGVIAMIDLLVKDLDKEMTEAETEEKNSQADYERMTKDSAAKRATDTSTLVAKQGAKADVEGDLERHKAGKVSTTKELSATVSYIQSLHASCDFLLEYYATRKEARASEVESLKDAKAVLSGANFQFVQLSSRFARRLRGSKPSED